MTSFFDPKRPRLLPSRHPCWLTAPHIALPYLCIRPCSEAGDWSISIMLGSIPDSSWHYLRLTFPDLILFLSYWNLNPEEALRQWAKKEPPNSTPAALDVNPDDLGI